MKKNIVKLHFALSTFFVFGIILFSPLTSLASDNNLTLRPDSIGNEILNDNRYVIHKLAPQETYYQLSRIYQVPVKDIMQANNKKDLRIGDTVKIPRGKVTAVSAIAPKRTEPKQENQTPSPTIQDIFTEYKVGKSETLYAISRRFDIPVEDIKRANNLTSDSLREGQILKIPNSSQSQPTEIAITPVPPIVEEHQPIDLSDFKTNQYGIREKKERGIGTWMDSLGDGQTSLALHKTAPIGTILKITNPMNKSVTFAKVVGKFGDNQDTHDAIVVISRSVAASLGLLDRRFQIELHYGAPLEE